MRRIGLLVCTLVVLFGAVACSSDDSGSAASTTPAVPTTAAPPSSTAPPAVQERLYYAKQGRIHVVVPGEQPTAVTAGPRDDQPAPSPDGKHLAYIRLADASDAAGELWIADADGANPKLLVPVGVSHDPASSEGEPAAAFRPTWSPDSSTIAFMTTIGLDGGDLQTVDPATGIVSAPEPTVWVSSYSWNRDGKSLVFVTGTNDVSPVDIGILDIATLSTRAVVDATAAYGGISVSPTGNEAIFVNSNLPLPPEGDSGFALAKPGLYSLPLDGGEPTSVAPDPEPDDYRWGVRDTAGCLWYARQFAEGTGQVLLHRLCAGDVEPASPVTDLALFPATPAVAGSNAIAYLVEGAQQSLFVLTKPDADPIHVDDGVTAFAWLQ
jgi:Tol biopolymer transport system component